jgi:hypothetical protein
LFCITALCLTLSSYHGRHSTNHHCALSLANGLRSNHTPTRLLFLPLATPSSPPQQGSQLPSPWTCSSCPLDLRSDIRGIGKFALCLSPERMARRKSALSTLASQIYQPLQHANGWLGVTTEARNSNCAALMSHAIVYLAFGLIFPAPALSLMATLLHHAHHNSTLNTLTTFRMMTPMTASTGPWRMFSPGLHHAIPKLDLPRACGGCKNLREKSSHQTRNLRFLRDPRSHLCESSCLRNSCGLWRQLQLPRRSNSNPTTPCHRQSPAMSTSAT